MTVVQLVIGPIVICALLATGLFWVACRVAAATIETRRAEQHAHEVLAAQGDAWHASYTMLRDACDAVIVELDSHPATYSTFPEPVRAELDHAHDRARDIEARGTTR